MRSNSSLVDISPTGIILIDGIQYSLSYEHIIFELSAGGRATFIVKGEVTVKQLVQFDIGYQGDMKHYFDGFVTKAQPAANGYTRLIARERAGLLAARWPVSIQHPTLSEIVEQLSFDTGLQFVLPSDADYTTKRIANFTSQGTGYQLMNNLGRAFSVDDFCWYQQTDGTLFIGSYADSRWANKQVVIPNELSEEQKGGNSMTLAVMPSVRPGAIINGKRLNRVEFQENQMTLYWQAGEKEPAEKRRLQFLFPELAAGHHLPRFARVINVTDKAQADDENNPFRSRFAVDIQLLDEDGRDDVKVPLYKAVSLPVMFGG